MNWQVRVLSAHSALSESMFVVVVIINLTAAAVLVSYLCIKRRQRVRSRTDPHDQGQPTAGVIDVAALKPRIDAVRRNYLVTRKPQNGLGYHRALLKVAGRAVAQLGYFRARKAEDQSHTNAA